MVEGREIRPVRRIIRVQMFLTTRRLSPTPTRGGGGVGTRNRGGDGVAACFLPSMALLFPR